MADDRSPENSPEDAPREDSLAPRPEPDGAPDDAPPEPPQEEPGPDPEPDSEPVTGGEFPPEETRPEEFEEIEEIEEFEEITELDEEEDGDPDQPDYMADGEEPRPASPATEEVEAVEILEDEPEELVEDGEDIEEVIDPIADAMVRAAEGSPELIEEALNLELEAETDSARKAEIQHELGRLYFSRLDDEGQAVKAYALALKQDPRLRPNIWAIRRIFVSRAMWPSLIKLLDAQLRHEQTARGKAEILTERGWIQEADQADLASAEESYLQAHEQDPTWAPPLLALEKIARARGDLETLATVYEALAGASESPARKAAALMALADIQLQLPEADAARAMEILEQAREAEGGLEAAVVRRMEEVAGRFGLDEHRTGLLEARAETLLAQDPPDGGGAAAVLREAANICRSQGDLEGAARHTVAALEALPDEPLLLDDMIALASAQENWEAVEEALLSKLESADNDLEKADLWFRVGMSRMARGGDGGESAARANELLPGYLPIQAERERLLLMDGEIEGLVDLYLAEAGAVEERSPGLPMGDEEDPAWAATLHWRAGALTHYQLDDQTRALELCLHALSLAPDFEPANHLLEDLYRATGSHEELAGLLERQLEQAEGEQQALLLEDLIALCGGPLDAPERQLGFIERLRGLRAEDPRPLRLMADALGRLGRHEEQEAALKQLEEREQDPETRAAWMMERARLYEGPLQRPDDAVATYQGILEITPEQAYAVAALEQVLVSNGKLGELAEHLARIAGQAEGDEERLTLQHRRLDLLEHDLEQTAEAVALATDILADHPEDLAAMRALARMSRQTGDAEGLARALEHQLERATEAHPRVLLQLQLAEVLAERLNRADQAEELLRAAVEDAPVPELVIGPMEALIRKQLSRGEHEAAAQGLNKVKDEAEPDQRPRLLEEMAWLKAGPLDSAGEGAALWREVSELRGEGYLPARWAALRLAAGGKDLAELSRLNAELAGQTEDEDLKATLRRRAALSAEAVGALGDDAAGQLRAVLEQDPGDAEALLGLLAYDGLEPPARADLMLDLAERLQGSQREQLAIPLALCLEDAGRLAAATAELTPLLERDPDNLAALLLLERMARTAGEDDQRVRLLVKLAGIQADQEARVANLRRAADLLLDLSRPEEAAALYGRILGALPDDEEALDALERLHREGEDLAALDRLLGHRIARARGEGRVDLLLQRARLRQEEMEDARAAAQDLLSVLQADGENRQALETLIEMYLEDKNTNRALELLRTLGDSQEETGEQRRLILREVEVLDEAGGRGAEAIQAYEHFLEGQPDDEELVEKVSELHLRAGDYKQAVEALERLGKLREEPEWGVKNLKRIAELCWRRLKDPQRALDALTRARALAPLDLDLVREMTRLQRDQGNKGAVKSLLIVVEAAIREALAEDPLSVELIKKLMVISEWREDQYTLNATLGVLSTLRATSKEEEILLLRALKEVAFKPWPDSLEAGGGVLIHPGARLDHGRIWRIAGVAVPAFIGSKAPADVSAFGLKKNDKVDRKTASQVTGRIDRIAAALGLTEEFDIYLSSKDPDLIAGVEGIVPALVVGHSVVSELNAGRRFRLGKALYLLRHGASALEQLSEEQLRLFYCAAVFSQNSKATLPLPAATLKPEGKKVVKALPRKLRKALSKAVAQGIPEPAKLEQWREGVVTTANRAGLLVSGHMVASVEAIEEGLRRDGSAAELSTEQAKAKLQDNEQATRLLVFSMGEEYLALRRDLGR